MPSGTTDMAAARPGAVATGMRITFAVAATLIVVALVIAARPFLLPGRLVRNLCALPRNGVDTGTGATPTTFRAADSITTANLQEHSMHSTTTVTVIASRPSRSRRHAPHRVRSVRRPVMLATADRSAEAQAVTRRSSRRRSPRLRRSRRGSFSCLRGTSCPPAPRATPSSAAT